MKCDNDRVPAPRRSAGDSFVHEPPFIKALLTLLTALLALFIPGCESSATSDDEGHTASVRQAVTPLYVYAADTASNTVAVFDTATNTQVTGTGFPIAVGNSPGRVAVTPDGSKVYVLNTADTTMSVISTSTNAVVATVSLAGHPRDAAITADSSKVYVLDNTSGTGGDVQVVDTSTNTVSSTVFVTTSTSGTRLPRTISVSPDGTKAYVVCGRGQVMIVSGESVAGPYGGGGDNERSGLLAPDGNIWSYILYSSVISIAEPTGADAGGVTNSTPIAGFLPGGIVFSPDGSTGYGSSGVAIDVGKQLVTGSFNNGLAITISPDGKSLYQTSTTSPGTISVVSTATRSVTATVTVSGATFGSIAIQPPPTPFIAGKQLGGDGKCNAANAACTLKRDGKVSAGEPIDVASGNVTYQYTDYTTAGQNPLAFTRYYNSRATSALSTLAASLGGNWRSNYDRYLQLRTTSKVIAERADGKQVTFRLLGSTWTPDSDVDITLTHSGSTWTLTDEDDTVESYTTATGGASATLNSITALNGYAQTLSYTSGQLTSVTDSYSRSLTFTYSGSRLATVATPDYTTITYAFYVPANQLVQVQYTSTPTVEYFEYFYNTDHPFLLENVIDENGDVYDSWTYDVAGRGLTSEQGSAGANLTTLAYGFGTTTVSNPLGVTDTYTFTTSQDMPKVTSISRAATSNTVAASESITYDSNGYLATLLDWNGNSTHRTNNSHGDPTSITDAYGTSVARTTTIAYNTTFPHLPATVTTPGVTTTFTYDSSGNQLTKTLTDTTSTSTPYSTNGQARTWTYTWSNHLLASVQSPRTDVTAVTSFGYDSLATLRSITDALGNVTSVTMAQIGGLPQRVQDPNGIVTGYSWDKRQRLEYVIADFSGGYYTTYYDHDAAGQLTQLYPPDGTLRQFTYDDAHRLTQVKDGYNDTIQYTLDALGNSTQTRNYNGTPTLMRDHAATFDALGRQLTDVGGASQIRSFTYDANGNVLTVVDGNSHTTTNTYDALNRLSTSTDANSGVVTTTYDAHDRPLTVQDQNGHTTSYVYNGFGDVIQQTSPDTGTTVYHYDNNGNLTQKVDAASVTVNQTFDKLDRVLTTTYPADTSLNVAYTYDQTGTGFSNGIGRLTSVSDKAGTLTRAYDPRGNLLTEKRVNSGTTYTTSYTYNGFNRLLSTTYPDGTVVSNQYDWPGNVFGMTATPAGGSAITLASLIDHFAFGPLKYIAYGNGNTETWFTDLDFRVTSIHGNRGPITSTQVMRLDYGYDGADNVTGITDYQTASNSQTLGYDVINRLHTAVSGSGGYGSYTYNYDPVGNLTSQVLGGTTTSYSYTSGTNKLSAIGATSISTNSNGNITGAPIVGGSTNATYTYSAANRLSGVSGGGSTTASYVYDAFGKRFSKTTGSTTLYFYDQSGNLLAEKNGSTYTDYAWVDGMVIAIFVPTASASADKINYVMTDRLGTPQWVDNNSQANVWSATYKPLGQGTTTGTLTNSIRLPGQSFDAETGFHQNGFRDYMPNLGRYLEADPIGLGGGVNPYLYANGNPAKYTDRTGLFVPVVVGVVEALGEFCAEFPEACLAILRKAVTEMSPPRGAPPSVGNTPSAGTNDPGCNPNDPECGKKQKRNCSPKYGLGGKGYRGDARWRQAVKAVRKGSPGSYVELPDKYIPTQQEALDLLNESGITDMRVPEEGHPAPNPHSDPHINYSTPSGVKGTIRIQRVE